MHGFYPAVRFDRIAGDRHHRRASSGDVPVPVADGSLHLIPLPLLVLGQKSANLRFGSGTNVHHLGSPIFDR